MSVITKISRKLRSLQNSYITYNSVYISRQAILHNYDMFAAMPANQYVIPVLKANAYGHGLEQLVSILRDRSMPYVAVDGYFEAIRIHEISDQPVLVMGAIDPRNFARIKTKHCAFVVHDTSTLEALAATGKKIRVHLELDTGMHRHGVAHDEIDDFLKTLKKYPKLELEGVMTHLADADNPRSITFTTQQAKLFDAVIEKILTRGYTPKYLHVAQTAGSTKVQSKYANTARIGIGLYGVNPLEKHDDSCQILDGLQPALTLNSTISKVIDLKKGDTVSYGRTFVAPKNMQIAVLPLGYYEAIPRTLSNVGVVQVRGTYAPIVGRVCMNHTMIDITDSSAQTGDAVVIFSSNTKDRNSIQSTSRQHKLFSYELLVGISSAVRRTIVD